jgi:hypothetical protein
LFHEGFHHAAALTVGHHGVEALQKWCATHEVWWLSWWWLLKWCAVLLNIVRGTRGLACESRESGFESELQHPALQWVWVEHDRLVFDGARLAAKRH